MFIAKDVHCPWCLHPMVRTLPVCPQETKYPNTAELMRICCCSFNFRRTVWVQHAGRQG